MTERELREKLQSAYGTMPDATRAAFEAGWRRVKLYFMMGLPTETYEDLDGISDICKKVAYCWRENTPNLSLIHI